MESRGSVIPLFKKQMKTKVLNITDTRMTRFTITLEGCEMVFWVLKTLLVEKYLCQRYLHLKY